MAFVQLRVDDTTKSNMMDYAKAKGYNSLTKWIMGLVNQEMMYGGDNKRNKLEQLLATLSQPDARYDKKIILDVEVVDKATGARSMERLTV